MQEPLVTQSWWRRPRLRLSLRPLMVIVLLSGGLLGWAVRRAEVQRQAVAAIMRGGGRVWYDWEIPKGRVRPDGEYLGGTPMGKRAPPGPKWLFDRLGPDYFGRVKQVQIGSKDPDAVMARVAELDGLEAVNFMFDVPVSDAGIKSVRTLAALKSFVVPIHGSKLTGASLEYLEGLTGLKAILLTTGLVLTDADMVHLKALTALQHLQLSSSAKNMITDAGLANIRDMVDMRDLSMTQAKVTSAGLNELRGMTRLHTLWIPATRVDDLAPIRHLTGLKFLYLQETPITDAGLAPVAGFTSLTTLILTNTPITDAGLKHLRGLTSLSQLGLSKTRITDAGLAELAGLKSLNRLELASTGVTDAGLVHLAGLQSLSSLDLSKTRVTAMGLKRLSGLKSLSRLTVEGAAITPEALTALEKAMPHVSVSRPRPMPRAPR